MQTYTFGMYNHLETIQEESRTGFCNQNVVVAGDPAQQGHKKGKACALPDTLFIKKLMLSLTYREGVFIRQISLSLPVIGGIGMEQMFHIQWIMRLQVNSLHLFIRCY